jgi:Domain of unknown function (DUF5005)/Domain of unknown function (DUF4185)
LKKLKYIAIAIGMIVTSCSKDEETTVPVITPPVEITCEQSSCWDKSLYVCRDSTYINLFTRTKGWTGGDATYSVDLKNGKTLWMFGDSFIDQVSEDRSRPTFRLINNSLVLQDGSTMKTFHGGTTINPQAFAKPPEDGEWYWPGDGTVANGKLYLFMHGFGTGGGGAWDFFRTSIDLLTLDPETLVIEDQKRLFVDPTISWGAAVMEDDDFTYVYGVESDDTGKRLFVARTNAILTAAWEYYSGTEWSPDPATANPVFEGVSEQFSIFKDGDTYYFLTQNNFFGKEIYLYTASAPEGPFDDKRTAYCTPETGDDIFTYNAFAHPHVYQDSLLVSYNVNSFDYTDILKSADNYRPYFVRIGGWRKQ